MKVALVGATGLVGKEMINVLEESDMEISTFIPVASQKSVGKYVNFKNESVRIVSLEDAVDAKPDIALFSAGGQISLKWAPEFAKNGTKVIDNSSAWRMNPDIKLIVPEINASELSDSDFIIANPNCSTIQMVMALAPLHEKYKIKRLVISTYQSISGTGSKAVEQLNSERKGDHGKTVYPHQIDYNCLPHCDDFTDNGYTKEEMKLVNETRKILGDQSLKITATAVRVPVVGGHSESVNVEFHEPFKVSDILDLLNETSGVVVQDDPSNNIYPMPLTAHGKDEVFVGRIRVDESRENTLNMWIVSDNLRKGAATNAVQIAEYLVNEFHFSDVS